MKIKFKKFFKIIKKIIKKIKIPGKFYRIHLWIKIIISKFILKKLKKKNIRNLKDFRTSISIKIDILSKQKIK